MEGQGDWATLGLGGGLPSPGEGPGMLPSLWLGWGPPRGDRPLVPTGETPVHGQGGGVGLAAVRPPHESSASSASAGDAQAERGLASPSSPSLCPWWSQIQRTPPTFSCELAPRETPQHPKVSQAWVFLSSALAIPPALDPLEGTYSGLDPPRPALSRDVPMGWRGRKLARWSQAKDSFLAASSSLQRLPCGCRWL